MREGEVIIDPIVVSYLLSVSPTILKVSFCNIGNNLRVGMNNCEFDLLLNSWNIILIFKMSLIKSFNKMSLKVEILLYSFNVGEIPPIIVRKEEKIFCEAPTNINLVIENGAIAVE